jgi:hypothetical protein
MTTTVMTTTERTPRRLSGRRAVAGAIAAVALLLVLSGCGIDDDAGPREITDASRPNPANSVDPTPGATSGTDRIYLLAPDSPNDVRHLRPTTRDVGDSATQRLTSLFGALTVADVSARLRTAIPDGLRLRSAALQNNGTLVVDVSDQILDLSSSTLIDAVAQIVFTASEVQGVERVELIVNGKPRQWPAGDGELLADPLTVYDYPGFIESTQPAFPAVPSPEA